MLIKSQTLAGWMKALYRACGLLPEILLQVPPAVYCVAAVRLVDARGVALGDRLAPCMAVWHGAPQ